MPHPLKDGAFLAFCLPPLGEDKKTAQIMSAVLK